MVNSIFSRFRRGLAPIFVLAALGACADGTSTDTADQERVAEFAAMTDRLGGLFNTGFTGQTGEMPSSGTAEFGGHAGFILDTGTAPLTLVGDAAMTANFETRRLTGQMTGFFGNAGGVFGDYSGTVTIEDGEIGVDTPRGASVPNDVRFSYGGILVGQGNFVVLDGDVTGKFKGTPIAGLLASSVPGETAVVNGIPVGATVAVAAEIR